jgi:hypothetical protein
MSDLVEFLRARLEEDERLWRERCSSQRRNGKTFARRMFVDVDAKRQIIDLHCVRSGTGGTWDTDPPAICNECGTLHPCETLCLLAWPYAAHADYREEWPSALDPAGHKS